MISSELSGYKIEKNFTSKKNNVYLLKTKKTGGTNEYLVYKKYSCPRRMQKEIEMLSLLKEEGLPVPRILTTGEDYIGLEYLQGTLLLDHYCYLENAQGSLSQSPDESSYIFIYELLSWFKKFYQVTGKITGTTIIMGDVNLRNFILKEVIYGIDFEESRESSIAEEIGSLCAFALTYDPAFTPWKTALVSEMQRIFAEELNLDMELLKKETSGQLSFLARIRGQAGGRS